MSKVFCPIDGMTCDIDSDKCSYKGKLPTSVVNRVTNYASKLDKSYLEEFLVINSNCPIVKQVQKELREELSVKS